MVKKISSFTSPFIFPKKGSTIGLNNSQHGCSSRNGGILESGMDNSPMYLNAFHDDENPKGVPPQWINERLQLYDCQMSFLFVSESQALQDLGATVGSKSFTPAVSKLLKTQETFMAYVNAEARAAETPLVPM